MSEVKKIATREGYGNALVELGKKRDDFVVLDADLAAATQTGMFKKAFPERFYDAGIAEANLVGVAAGLATKCEVQIAYAIGIAKPVSVMIDTFGTATVDEEKITAAVNQLVDLRPAAIIKKFDLRKPIYKQR